LGLKKTPSVNVNDFLMRIFKAALTVLISLIFFSVTASASEPMRFEKVERCKGLASDSSEEVDCVRLPQAFNYSSPVILAYGDITRQSDEQFSEFANSFPPQTIIIFQSLGGDVHGSLRLGQAIRARGFNTYIPDAHLSKVDPNTSGKCFSACAYAFLGGNLRGVDTKAQYGVHQFRGQGAEISIVQAQKLSAVLARYLDSMMVNRQLLDQALLTDPGKLNLIPVDLRQAWLVENMGRGLSGNSSLARWKIDVASGGKRLAFATQKQKNSSASLTLAFTYVGEKKTLSALLILRPDPSLEGNPEWLSNFSVKIPVVIDFESQIYADSPKGRTNKYHYQLIPISNWMGAGPTNTPGTRQIWLATSPELMARLQAANQFTVKPLWVNLPKGFDELTVFSTQGLSDTLLAL